MFQNKFLPLVLASLIFGVGIFIYNLLNPPKPDKRVLPYYSFSVLDGTILEQSIPGEKVSKIEGTDHSGRSISEKDLKDKISVVDFFFIKCPGICKQMGNQLQRVDKAFASDPSIQIFSFTSKPDEDTIDSLAAYAILKKASPKWHFITGNLDSLYSFAQNQLRIAGEPEGEEKFVHTEKLVLIDKQLFIRGYYDGTDSLDTQRLISDIQTLK